MTRYLAHVGRAVARWLADPATGPLSPCGFYGRDALGTITDLKNGWIALDQPALDTLRAIPSDRDGYVSDEDGPQLCIGADRHPVITELPEEPRSPEPSDL